MDFPRRWPNISRGYVMDKHLKECLNFIATPIERAVMSGHVSGAPFVDFTSQAASVFTGFEVIVELLQIDLLREDCDDEEDRLMTARQKDALLGLISAMSRSMNFRVGDISEWADKRLQEKGGKHGN